MGDYGLPADERADDDVALDDWRNDPTHYDVQCIGCGAYTTGVSKYCSTCYECEACGLIGPGCCEVTQ